MPQIVGFLIPGPSPKWRREGFQGTHLPPSPRRRGAGGEDPRLATKLPEKLARHGKQPILRIHVRKILRRTRLRLFLPC